MQVPQERLNRRQALRTGAAFAGSTYGIVTTMRQATGSETRTSATRIDVHDVQVLPGQPDAYYGWPTLASSPQGRLYVVASGGREAHVCPFGRVEMMQSDDLGATWTYPQVILDGPIDDRDAGVLVTRKGTVLVTTFTSLAYVPTLKRFQESQPDAERTQRWNAVHQRLSDSQRQAALGVWMMRSTDQGMTWSTPYDCLVNSPHGPIELSDGRLLYAGKQLWQNPARVGVCHSTDDGKTWQWLAEIPTRAGDKSTDYHELHAVEAADGRIVVHIRNHNPTDSRETLQVESKDGGRTWSTPRSIGVWGLPSHLLRLGDGRLLMSYGYRRKPFGNQIRISDDHGESWSEPLTLSGDGASGDLGYPSTVELPNGQLATLWYEKMSDRPRAVLRLARWSLKP